MLSRDALPQPGGGGRAAAAARCADRMEIRTVADRGRRPHHGVIGIGDVPERWATATTCSTAS